MSRRIEIVILLLVLCGALALRAYDLRGAPPGAQHDEVFSANFATQILDGARPVYWDQNGGVPALHSYLVALAIALFGTAFSLVVTLRMVSVVCGLATIVFTYLTARHLFGVGVALFAAALISASQWHLFESRVGLEPITLMLLSSLTAWGFVRLYVGKTIDDPVSFGPAGEAGDSTAHPKGPWAGRGGRRRTTADGALRATDNKSWAIETGSKSALAVIKGQETSSARHPPDRLAQMGSSVIGLPTVVRRLSSIARRLPSDVLVGVALGLTMYTYQPGPLVGLALAAFAGYLLVWQRQQFQAQWQSMLRLFVVAALVVSPLLIHFMTTAGDASSRMEDLAADLKGAAAGDIGPLASDITGVLGMLAFSGDPSYRYNLPGRPVFTLVVGLLAYAGLLLALWRWRDSRFAFIVIWIGCTVIASAVTRASPSYLRSSPALVMLVMLPGVALSTLSHTLNIQLATRHAQGLIVALALGLVGWEAASTAQDYFGNWANLDRVRTTYRADLAETAAFLDTQKPSGTVMLSARYPSDLDQGALYLLQQQPRQRYQWFNGRRVLVLPRDVGGQGAAYFIPASNGSLGDGAALLNTLDKRPGPLDENAKPAFVLYTLPAAALAQLRARAPQIPLHANAGNEVELIGLDTQWTARNLHVLLYWQVVHRVPGDNDRSFFTHLVDVNGKLWTQEDHSAYPTSSWQDGDIVWQWYDLQVPPDAPAGDYWLEVGIYDANAPGQPRVPIIGPDGKVADNHVRVQVISR